MTNGEKFKTAKERHEAYDLYCESCRSLNLAILHDKFEWLELEYKAVLKNCPFCGGEAIIDKETPYMFPIFRVKCSDCEMKTEVHTYKQNAIDAWNRRVK